MQVTTILLASVLGVSLISCTSSEPHSPTEHTLPSYTPGTSSTSEYTSPGLSPDGEREPTLSESVSQPPSNVVFSVQQILSIEPIDQAGSVTIGDTNVPHNTSEWLQRATDRIVGASWQFSNDGRFVFYLPNGRTDLYPISGSYTVSGKSISFEGKRVSNDPSISQVAQANSFVKGSVDLEQNPPIMNIQWGSTSIDGASIGGTGHGSNKTAAYTASLLLAGSQ